MQLLAELQKKGTISAIDLYLAEMLLPLKDPIESFVFLVVVCAISRLGHLCLRIEENQIIPSLQLFSLQGEDRELLEKLVREGEKQLPQKLYSSITEEGVCKTPLCRFQGASYLQKNWLLQQDFFFHVQRLLSFSLPPIQEERLSCLFADSVLTEGQKLAAKKALTSPVSLITGGPGTGKSFTAVEILRAFLQLQPESKREKLQIKLAAPTGKAASLLEKNILQKIGKLSTVVCGTIHSFLSEKVLHGTLVADFLLVDEASMIDAKLFVRLLSALRPGGCLIFMGDKDQLPPVELGSFFSDLIEKSEALSLPVTFLQKSLRVETTSLQRLAESVLAGDHRSVQAEEGVQLLSASISEWKERVWQECQKFFSFASPLQDDYTGVLTTLDRFKILSCMRQGPLGVEHLNQEILHRFLHNIRDEEWFLAPILITKNDKNLQLMNGDVGVLLARSSSYKRGQYIPGDKAYFLSKEEERGSRMIEALVLPSFEFAYCLSVHKSQGSEYETVLLLVPSGSERLGKEVLYTGVTRAKKNVTILTEEQTLLLLLRNSARKYSGLSRL